MTKEDIIKELGLERHPEGGAFKETYRSPVSLSIEGFEGSRSISTAIYFLIGGEDYSAFHRIKSDELWHFYQGSPLVIVEISPEGIISETELGSGLNFQYAVKAGNWFASYSKGEVSLVGCTVSPGFDFSDFELAEYKHLAKQYPEHEEIIKKLT